MKKRYISLVLVIIAFIALTVNMKLSDTTKTKDTEVSAAATLKKPKVVAVRVSNSAVDIYIDMVDGANEYGVYRATSRMGKYEKRGTTTSCTYTDKAKNTKSYYYKVVATATMEGKLVKSKYSKVMGIKSTSAMFSADRFNADYAQEVLSLINKERENEGLNSLTTTENLQKAANKRAIEIQKLFSHTRPNSSSCFTVCADYNINYRCVGENIAKGQNSPKEVVKAWMDSPGHRANILRSQYGKVGIGVYKDKGKYYWTQVFMN